MAGARAGARLCLAGLALTLAGPAMGEPGTGYCGPEVPKTAFGNDTFWKPSMSYMVGDARGQHVLIAEGGVGDNEAAAMAEALQKAGNIDEVWLSSPGGNMAEGMKIGRLLHGKGLAVRVPDGHACISSCTLAFLGGALRSVDPKAYYGIHMFTLYGDAASGQAEMQRFNAFADEITKKYGQQASGEAYAYAFKILEQRSAIAAAALARYLVEMSASLDFLTGMTGQQNVGVCFVTREGLTRYNVTNVQ